MEELLGYQFNINVSGDMQRSLHDDFQFVQYGQVSCFSLMVTMILLGLPACPGPGSSKVCCPCHGSLQLSTSRPAL